MTRSANHSACVDAWMNARAKDLSPAQWVDAFEETFSALWQRARLTLGDVTLAAIAGRVLYGAAERFPALSALEVDPSGLKWRRLRDAAESIPLPELVKQLRFILVEFLRVLGSLTAEILTPALHAELRRRARAAPVPTAKKDGEETP